MRMILVKPVVPVKLAENMRIGSRYGVMMLEMRMTMATTNLT
jgi:hypothetical protein